MVKTKDDSLITFNKKAQHEYFLEQSFEAGIVLEGWEVKSLRAGKINLQDGYIIIKGGELWLLGAHISPLPTAAKHTNPDPIRTRKLLLHAKEITKLIGLVERRGYTLIPVRLYWKHSRVKLQFAIAKGKKLYDKRQSEKERDWARDKSRVMASLRKR